jgi:hypothetical protein
MIPIPSKILRTEVPSYEGTKILSKVRKYFRTKVPSKVHDDTTCIAVYAWDGLELSFCVIKSTRTAHTQGINFKVLYFRTLRMKN